MKNITETLKKPLIVECWDSAPIFVNPTMSNSFYYANMANAKQH